MYKRNGLMASVLVTSATPQVCRLWEGTRREVHTWGPGHEYRSSEGLPLQAGGLGAYQPCGW